LKMILGIGPLTGFAKWKHQAEVVLGKEAE
jgi:hypothetical protein